ncbi:MAG: arsenate reductase ArsC [Pseudomonadales bacterium]
MKILFICTHNRCRSILAEAICNHISNGRIEAKSAGSQPAGVVHPLSLKFLAEAGIATQGLSSQSWDEYEAWTPEVVITVCDSAAGEQCPLWLSQAIKVHWGLPDPSRIEGSEEQIKRAFQQTMQTLQARIECLLASNFEQQNEEQIRALFENIGNR